MDPKLLEPKRASWLELFYDVAFVALVAQLTYLAYEHHHTLTDFFHIFIIGYAIFITWVATTANRNMKDDETTKDKVLIQLQMVGAFIMSITMAAVFEGNYLGFFITLAGLRLLQSLMLMHIYYVNPEERPNSYNILQGFLAGTFFWILTAFLPAPYYLITAFMALAVDILTPLTKGKGNKTRYLNVHHLQERLGLFLMLVIGESMIVVALANTATDYGVTEPLVVFSGIGMMIALWWLYYEHTERRQGVRSKNLSLFLHSHGFLFGSIILLSVGYKIAISKPDSIEALLFVSAGALGALSTLLFIRTMLHDSVQDTLKLFVPFVLIGVIAVCYMFLNQNITGSIVIITALFILIALVDQKLSYKRGPLDVSQLPS